MYKGAVTVSQQQAPSFLKAALLLKVAGNNIYHYHYRPITCDFIIIYSF